MTPAKSTRETTKLAHPVKEIKHTKFLTFYGSVHKADIIHCQKYAVKKVKEFCYRPGVAQRVPGGLGSQIS
jgi:hypothetical protein